jgi:hypothetical protein
MASFTLRAVLWARKFAAREAAGARFITNEPASLVRFVESDFDISSIAIVF